MRIHNLGSGSGGNATVVSHRGRAILIDAGLSKRRMLDGLVGLKLEAVLITHRHRDHLGTAARLLGAPLRMDARNADAARRLGWLDGARVELFDDRPFRAGPFRVTPFALPHPGNERWHSWGFRVEHGTRRFSYATDLGHVAPDTVEALSDAAVVFLESNHDVALERRSGRPRDLIDWVLSPHGHLSNEQCAEALARVRTPHTVIVGHVSRECNLPLLALAASQSAVGRKARVWLAHQDVEIAPIDA